MDSIVTILVALNAAIAFVFCWGITRRAGGVSLSWPPTFLRVVASWIGAKGVWLLVVAYLWGRHRVGYLGASTIVDRILYPSALAFYTFWHLYAAWCWLTGKVVIRDRP